MRPLLERKKTHINRSVTREREREREREKERERKRERERDYYLV
jgi:hypothetical protein